MNIMYIKPQAGINADGFEVRIQDNEDNKIFNHSYSYQHDASYSKEQAERAHREVENAKKYGWEPSAYRGEKPYTTDILVELVNKYEIEKIVVTAGKYAFSDKPMRNEDVDKFVEEYIIKNSQLVELIET